MNQSVPPLLPDSSAASLPDQGGLPDPMTETSFQEKLARTRTATELGRVVRSRNVFMVLTLLLGISNAVLATGFKTVVYDWAGSVRVAWVKLFPNGDGKVEYLDDGGHRDRYYDRAVDASLTNYLIWRFRVDPPLIQADYGRASTFLGSTEADKFLNDFKAAGKALAAARCQSCARYEVSVRSLSHNLLSPATASSAAVTKSTAVIRLTERDAGGGQVSEHDEIVTLDWTLLPVSEAGSSLDRLKDNPLGIQIIAQTEQKDRS